MDVSWLIFDDLSSLEVTIANEGLHILTYAQRTNRRKPWRNLPYSVVVDYDLFSWYFIILIDQKRPLFDLRIPNSRLKCTMQR